MLQALMSMLMLTTVTHPAMPLPVGSAGLAGLRSTAAPMLAFTPQQLYNMVPVGSGIIFCGCPACNAGADEYFEVNWTPDLGDTVRCRNCGTILPNATYPNNGQITITSPAGVQQVYPYYQDGSGKRYFFQARAWYDRGAWLMSLARVMANIYALTGETQYGDRAAAIVGRMAFLYKQYPNRYDYPFRNLTFYPAYDTYPFSENGDRRPCKLYHWAYGDIPTDLLRAYDMLAGGDALDRMASLIGTGMETKMNEDVMRWSYESIKAWPDAYDNMMPYTYSSMVIAGRVGHFPDMVHHAINQARTLMSINFTQDGWWNEGAPSYHAQVVQNMDQLINVSNGYTDPPGFVGTPFVNFDLASEIPQLEKSRRLMSEGVLPNGRRIPINDTWSADQAGALSESRSVLWPGLGHAILGAGRGGNQFQLHMNWSGNYGHSHYDNAGIILWAFGRELIPDIGYTLTSLRSYATSTAAHNTVLIDAGSQRYGTVADPATGNLRWYDASDPHVRWMDLDGRPAYPNTSEYRRRLVHVHAGEGCDYVLDVFDAAGGNRRDYMLHGSADEPGTLNVNVLTQSVAPGAQVVADYPLFSAMRQWTSDGGAIEATFQYGAVRLRTRIFQTGNTVFYTFNSPAIRPANEIESEVLLRLRPGLLLRHAGGPSRFTLVHEPFLNSPLIQNVSVDTNWDSLTTSFTISRGGAVDRLWIYRDRVKGISTSGWSYDSGAPLTGKVLVVERGTSFSLLLDQALPNNVTAIRLQFGTARSMVLPARGTGGTRLNLPDDPGFSYNPTTRVSTWHYFPNQPINGELTYVVMAPNSSQTGVTLATDYE